MFFHMNLEDIREPISQIITSRTKINKFPKTHQSEHPWVSPTCSAVFFST